MQCTDKDVTKEYNDSEISPNEKDLTMKRKSSIALVISVMLALAMVIPDIGISGYNK